METIKVASDSPYIRTLSETDSARHAIVKDCTNEGLAKKIRDSFAKEIGMKAIQEIVESKKIGLKISKEDFLKSKLITNPCWI